MQDSGGKHPAHRFAEKSADLLAIADCDGRFTWLSPSWTSCLGWTPEQIQEMPFLELVHPDDAENTVRVMSRLLEGHAVQGFRNRYRTANGSYRWLEWNTRMVDGELVGAARDVTRNQLTLLDLQAQVARLQEGERIGHTGSWSTDAQGRLHWSPEVFRIHGRDPARGEPGLEEAIAYYHPEDRAHVQRCVDRALSTREPFEFELRLVREDGLVRFVQSIGEVRIGDDGEVAGMVGVFRDLTDEDRRRRHEELELYAHALCHDLREPVRTIGSFLPLIFRGLELDEERAGLVQFAMEAGERMAQQLDGLLRYTRAGVPRPLGPVQLEPLVDGIVRDLGMQAVVERGTLPAVHGDAVLLRQVFANLLDNASLYRAAERPLAVRIRAERGGGVVRVRVEDDGIGFRPQEAVQIFAPFRRLGEKSVPGVGMGLTLVSRLVARCDGRVEAEGRPGEGATFTLVLQAP